MPKPKLSDFDSYNNAADYFQSTPEFANMAPVDRVKALDMVKQNYQRAHLAKAVPPEAKIAASDDPDEPGLAARVRDKLMSGADEIGGGAIATPIGKTLKFISSELPDSNAQAAIDAVMLASMFGGEGEAAKGIGLAEKAISKLPQAAQPIGRLAGRMAMPTIAGAIGGETEGHPFAGAARGAGEALGGEAIAGASRFGRQTIQKGLDLPSVSGWLEKHLGEAGEMRSVAQFSKKIEGGELNATLSQEHNQTTSKIVKKLGKLGNKGQLDVEIPDFIQKKMNLPINKISVGLNDANHLMSQVEDLGWDLSGKAKMTQTGETARSLAIQMEDDIGEEIDKKLGRGAATDWLTSRYRQRVGKTVTKLFKEAGIDESTGLVNWPKLQKLASGKYRMDLQMSLGPDANILTGSNDTEDFLKKLYRGTGDFAKTDQVGKGNPYLSASIFGPRLGLSRPQIAKHVGELPYNLGRGRALSAGLVLGPYKVIQFAKDLAGLDEQNPDGASK